MLIAVKRRLGRTLENRGVAGTLALLPRFARSQIRRGLGALAPGRRRFLMADRSFDQAMGIDTHGVMALTSLKIDSPNQIHCHGYQPSPADDFEVVLGAVGVDFSKFVFIDIGAGKGRTLVMAAQHPFREVIGVEFSPELCEVAGQNIINFRSPARRCPVVKTVCADATEYPLPPVASVIYMYNPFKEPVMVPFLRSLEASLAAHPRELYLIYYNARVRQLMDASPALELVTDDRGPPALSEPWAIYRARHVAAQ